MLYKTCNINKSTMKKAQIIVPYNGEFPLIYTFFLNILQCLFWFELLTIIEQEKEPPQQPFVKNKTLKLKYIYL